MAQALLNRAHCSAYQPAQCTTWFCRAKTSPAADMTGLWLFFFLLLFLFPPAISFGLRLEGSVWRRTPAQRLIPLTFLRRQQEPCNQFNARVKCPLIFKKRADRGEDKKKKEKRTRTSLGLNAKQQIEARNVRVNCKSNVASPTSFRGGGGGARAE